MEILDSVQNLIKESLDPGIKFMRECMCMQKYLTPDWFTNTFGSDDVLIFHAVFPQARGCVPLKANFTHTLQLKK